MRVLLSHSDSRSFEIARFGEAWRRAGGDPEELVPVTPSRATAAAEGRVAVAGLLLTGGPDVEPQRYGRAPDSDVALHPDPRRDELDLGLLADAERQGWPVLGVCYGCQVLNVFYGGTLIQDLEIAGRSGHFVREPKDFLAHSVRLTPAAAHLAGLPSAFRVNSRHHQAIDLPAGPLAVTVRAEDGVVEAVERTDAGRFVVGVQWHPENLASEPHTEIFRRFLAACLRRARDAGDR
jgi:putative glutamine amidotransferase